MAVKILGAQIAGLDMMETLCQIDLLISNKGKMHHVITLNAEILYRAQTDEELMRIINTADLVTPDGSGIVWAVEKLTGTRLERVTGVDLMMNLCEQAHHTGWRLFFLGGKPGVAEEAGAKLSERFDGLDIAGIRHGYFGAEEEADIINEINASGSDILFVAMGAPRQEFWLDRQRDDLRVPVAIGIGGSLDVAAGRVKRAPVLMQKIGMEWFWRLCREPWRIKRMLVLPRFMRLVAREKKKKSQNDNINRPNRAKKSLP